MNKLNDLRKQMQLNNIDYMIITSSDYHNSEYVDDYYAVRSYFSDFTGSAGTLLVGTTTAYLWVDGRYFLQAHQQVPKDIQVMEMGEPNVPTLIEFLSTTNYVHGRICVDARTITTSFANNLLAKLVQGTTLINLDIPSIVWTTRPLASNSKIELLANKYTGQSANSKITQLLSNLTTNEYLVIGDLCEIAYLLNFRAKDIKYNPVAYAYIIATKTNIKLFIDPNKLKQTHKQYFEKLGIELYEYNSIYKYLEKLKDKVIKMNYEHINYAIYLSSKNNKIVNTENYISNMKVIKNKTEIANTKEAHLKDGIAMCKFFYYVKTNQGDPNFSELSLAEYLDNLRKTSKDFIELSFNTIAAYKDHGAIVHYSATIDSNYLIDDSGFFLVDSGAHYLQGTTDITRTIAIGNSSSEEKNHYTYVLAAMIDLSSLIFKKGCTGSNIDIIARRPLWEHTLDYNHGTGHGVGHILSVHEEPLRISYKAKNDIELKAGMIISNEPGLYLENKYGIRIENQMLIKEYNKEYLCFEPLTLVPIDLDCINDTILTTKQKNYLNNYHQLVYNTIAPHLSLKEQKFLKHYTRKI
ncbi:MAG: aminopeptidase P family protein [Erysipelotrichaceae bacterium]